jgi:hypothetical protein
MKLYQLMLFSFLLFFTNIFFAQYAVGKHYAGPSLGLSFLGSSVQLGANYEYGMDVKEIGIDAPGKLGIGGIVRYWSYSEKYFGGEWSYTDILIGAQANYHFKIGSDKWDPWAGITLAYDVGSVDWDGPGGNNYSEPTYGGFFLGGNAGIRYWVSPTLALSARFGFGTLSYSALDLGVDLKF